MDTSNVLIKKGALTQMPNKVIKHAESLKPEKAPKEVCVLYVSQSLWQNSGICNLWMEIREGCL